MTAREKLAMEHPERVYSICLGGCAGCPDTYEYLPAPECCKGSIREGNHVKCTACWDREIPENTEKERDEMLEENMVGKKDEPVENTETANREEVDYKAVCECLAKKVAELTFENIRQKRYIESLKMRNDSAYQRIERYEAVIRCTEAFLGTKIIEGKEGLV